MPPIHRVCVYCGSSSGARPHYAAAAKHTGTLLGARGIGLVFGGGGVGLMGIVADAALAAGAEVIGVIPNALAAKEVAHRKLTDLRVVGSMHERKAVMADLADAFIALPGGMGTLDELFEILTWAQLGLHEKPAGLLDVEGYFRPLVTFLDHAVTEGFVREPHRRLLTVADTPEALLEAFEMHQPPRIEKWIDRHSI
jgi:hypothetical protein